MADALPTITKPPSPTDARFTTRGLLIVMTYAAVLALAARWALSHVSPPERTRVVAYWSLWLCVILIGVALEFWRRRRAEIAAGEILMRVPVVNTSNAGGRIASHLLFGLYFLYLSAIGTNMLFFPARGAGFSEWTLSILVSFVVIVIPLVSFVPNSLWHHDVRICKNGIVWGQSLVLWSDVVEHRWTGATKNTLELFSTDSLSNKPWAQIPIAADRVAEVESLLAAKASPMPFKSARVHAVGIGQLPIYAVIRGRHLRRHLMRVLISLLCGAALAILVLARNPGNREFNGGLYVTFLASCLLIGTQWNWVGKSAGPLIVRIFSYRDWFGLVLSVVFAVVIYLLAEQIVWPIGWLGYIAGAAYCLVIIHSATYFILSHLDLRQDGIVMPRAFCWHWNQVRVVTWDRQNSGLLILAHGWRRVHSIVMPEQRAAVDAVLRVKLGDGAARSSGEG